MTDPSANPELIEEVSHCPYCHSSQKHVIVTKNLLRIVACPGCGLKYTDRRWNTQGMSLYYQEGYYMGKVPGAHKNYEAEKDEKLRDFTHKFRFLQQFCPKGRLLDVGCATGFSLLAAQALGFTPEGLEFSEWAVQHNRTGLKIYHQELLDFKGHHAYDAISMWDVIEHLPEPDKAFHKLRELLRAGGILIFTYPDPTSLFAKIAGKRWGVFTPEEHYFFYPAEMLEQWLRKYGLYKRHESLEQRYCSLGKLAQKLFPLVEKYLHSIHLHPLMIAFPIPYKRMAVFQRNDS